MSCQECGCAGDERPSFDCEGCLKPGVCIDCATHDFFREYGGDPRCEVCLEQYTARMAKQKRLDDYEGACDSLCKEQREEKH